MSWADPAAFQSAPSSFFKRTYLLHQLGDDLVLGGQLGLAAAATLRSAGDGPAAFALPLEGGRAVLEELLLPLVELGRLDVVLVAQVGDRHAIDQVPLDDGHLLLRRKVPPLPRVRSVLGCPSWNPPALGVMLTPAKENSSSD